MISKQIYSFAALSLSAVAIVGCSDGTSIKPAVRTVSETAPVQVVSSHPASGSVPSPAATAVATEHGHQAGAHGGIMISLGRDSFHAEAVFEKGGVLRLYMLGKDESRVIDVETQTLKGFVKADGDAEAHPFTLEAESQEGDAAGRTSQFVGKLPMGLWGMNLDVTVPNIVIAGERFRMGFKSASEQHDEAAVSKGESEEDRILYLTPGGKYTEEDIKANGNATPTVKFKGLKSSHDMFPKPGDKICPVTKTKANPQFTWVVDGKSYEFCCPPCVEEFVKTAKSTPEEILLPTDYVKSKEVVTRAN